MVVLLKLGYHIASDEDAETTYLGENEGGTPLLVFTDGERAVAEKLCRDLNLEHWPQVTPLNSYFDSDMAALSSSGLNNRQLATRVNRILKERHTLDDVAEMDFEGMELSDEEHAALGSLFDLAVTHRLVEVPAYAEAVRQVA